MRGDMEIPMARMRLTKPRPRAPMRAMAMTNAGKASMMSMTRLITRSVLPPKYPAATPRNIPIRVAMAMEETAAKRETRVPQKRRLRMSRPT